MKEFRLLRENEIDCRIAMVKENYVTVLLYKDARVDQNILDEAVGAMNWQRKHTRDNANCIVSIWDDEKKQWVEKEDTGKESYTEKEKGLASDSFKRACFNWGIGRELYTAPFIKIEDVKIVSGKCYEKFSVKDIEYNDKREIIGLTIVNGSGKVVYQLVPDGKITPAMKRTLDTLIPKHGQTVEQTCKYFKVSSLEELTVSQFKTLMSKMGES